MLSLPFFDEGYPKLSSITQIIKKYTVEASNLLLLDLNQVVSGSSYCFSFPSPPPKVRSVGKLDFEADDGSFACVVTATKEGGKQRVPLLNSLPPCPQSNHDWVFFTIVSVHVSVVCISKMPSGYAVPGNGNDVMNIQYLDDSSSSILATRMGVFAVNVGIVGCDFSSLAAAATTAATTVTPFSSTPTVSLLSALETIEIHNRLLASNPAAAKKKKKGGICIDFKKSGKCRFGDKCTYRHEIEGAEDAR